MNTESSVELRNLKVSPDLHRKIKKFIADRDDTLQSVTERALLREIGEPTEYVDSLAGLPKERRALIKRMVVIWQSAPTRVQADLDKVVSGVVGAMEKVTGITNNN